MISCDWWYEWYTVYKNKFNSKISILSICSELIFYKGMKEYVGEYLGEIHLMKFINKYCIHIAKNFLISLCRVII